MKTYQPITSEIIDKLKAITGPSYVKTDRDILLQYQTDYETNPAMFRVPEAAVLPANAEEISQIVKLANEYDFPITVRGGGTSLAAGAIPVCGGLVLSMERLNKIIELNEEGMYMTVEAGVRTIDMQNEAKKVGLLYAGDPSSAESCLIGGNLATNAGGLRAVRYGVTRDQVYSLEIVTPTGDIVECGRILKKCSTGYDLEQLIIGSEGTLGIITVETVREDELDAKMDTVCTICEESGAVEVLEADDRIWNMRRNVQTSCEMISKVFLTDDVVVPVHKIASTIEKIMEIGENYPFQVKINAHIGDGNLHIVLCKMDMSDEEWNKNVEEFHQQVYAYAYSVGGRLAGEHGIGAKKLKYMEQFTPQGELKVMKTIKRAMDPNLILNPGKVIDA